MQIRFFLIVILDLGFLPSQSPAQETINLDKGISISLGNAELPMILTVIQIKSNVAFSYNPQTLDLKKRMPCNYRDVPLRVVLEDIAETYQLKYKTRNNYIILTPLKPMVLKPQAKQVSGYVYNSKDSSRMEGVSVYIRSTRHSAQTNRNGYFSVPVSTDALPISVSFAKEHFKDTSFTVQPQTQTIFSVYLKPGFDVSPIHALPPKLDTIAIEKEIKEYPDYEYMFNKYPFFIINRKRIKTNYQNIKDTLFSKIAFSIAPSISTNRLLAVNTINRFSFNLLVGYAKGVNGVELAGLMNIDNGSVQYVQLAGLANLVKDTVKGVQAAGLFNVVKERLSGMQSAGIFNACSKVNGAQLAGVFNVAHKLKGFQSAGVFNYAHSIDGMQSAGLFNAARSFNGFQLAGLFNRAGVVHGVQLAPFNFSDSCYGIPIGIFSIVKHGYHKIETAFNELSFVSLGFRTGVAKFHNIIALEISTTQSNLFGFSYGFGSSQKIAKSLFITSDLTAHQFLTNNFSTIQLNTAARLQSVLDFTLFKKLQLGVGPAFNFLVEDSINPVFTDASFRQSIYRQITTNGDFRFLSWVGFLASIKIL